MEIVSPARIDTVTEKSSHSFTTRYIKVPAVGNCECGATVYLEAFINTCSCGRDYDRSGQQAGGERGGAGRGLTTGGGS